MKSIEVTGDGVRSGGTHPEAAAIAPKNLITQYDVRKDIIDPAHAEGRFVTLPILPVFNDLRIPSVQWRKSPDRLVEAVHAISNTFNTGVLQMPMDLTALAGTADGRGVLEYLNPPADSGGRPDVRSSLDVDSALSMGLPEKLDGTLLQVRLDAIGRLRRQHPEETIVEFVPAPFTLATKLAMFDMVLMDMAMNDGVGSPSLNALMEKTTDMCIRTIRESAKAAGNRKFVVAMPDPSASGDIINGEYFKYAAGYTQMVVKAAREVGSDAILHVCGHTLGRIEDMCGTGVSGISCECRPHPKQGQSNPATIRDSLARVRGYNEAHGTNVFLMAGMPTPQIKTTMDDGEVASFSRELMAIAREDPNLVLSSACEIPVDTPVTRVGGYVTAVQEGRR